MSVVPLPRPHRSHLLLWVALLAFLAPAAQADAQVRPDVRHVLFELGDPSSVDTGELFDALLPLGGGAAEDLVGALNFAYVPGADGRPRKLERRRREALTDALSALPTYVLRLHLSGELPRQERTPAVELALTIVGSLGRSDQLSTAFALAETASSERLERRVARALESCLTGLLERHPEAHARLAARFREVQTRLRWSVVRAVGEARQREGLAFFAQTIGEYPELDLCIVTEVGRIAATHEPPYDWSFRLRLRRYLSVTDPSLRREAAGTMARMEDREAFGAIVELLSDPDVGVRENALWAARRLSGKGFGAEPEPWRLWYEEQLAWWSERAPELIARLTSGRGADRLKGLGELASRPLFRHDLAKQLSPALTHRTDVALLKGTCGALGDLGSPLAMPALIELLEHPERLVREQAWGALRRISGEELPSDPLMWAALLP